MAPRILIFSWVELSRQICDPTAVFPGKRAPDTHSMGVSVGLRKDREKIARAPAWNLITIP